MNPIARFLARALLVFASLNIVAAAQAQNTMVRLHTTQGPIDMKLLDAEAPLTVANFLAYVRSGDYTEVFVHRSAWLATSPPTPFVVQAGGFKWPAVGAVTTVASRGTVTNEFSPARSNVRATVAMAKTASDPNSATSQWFINMGNNAGNLDNQNGGFTVFAHVTAPGMVVADAIAALPVVNAGGVFSELPVTGWQGGTTVQRNHVVLITQARELPAPQNSSDRIFNYLEAAYPQFLSPPNGAAGEALGYQYRYYSGSNAYVGTKGRQGVVPGAVDQQRRQRAGCLAGLAGDCRGRGVLSGRPQRLALTMNWTFMAISLSFTVDRSTGSARSPR